MNKKITGLRAFVRCLEEQKVTTIFGCPGGAAYHLTHTIVQESRLNFILVRHEQAAVHAADGYFRSSGKTAVVLVSSGPGATNTLTGIATAYADSIPVVVFTGQVPTHSKDKESFQQIDIVSMSKACTKKNYKIRKIEEFVSTVRDAFRMARTGRPGPVLVDIPSNILFEEIIFPSYKEYRFREENIVKPDQSLIEQACTAILESKKPLLYLGAGIKFANAYSQVHKLAKLLNIPVAMSLLGLGAFNGKESLSLGLVGMHGNYASNLAASECDLLIAIGTRCDSRISGKPDAFVSKAKVIHIDIDPLSIKRDVVVNFSIASDCNIAIKKMISWFNACGFDAKKSKILYNPWLKTIRKWKAEGRSFSAISNSEIDPFFVIKKLDELAPKNAIVTTGVGQHQMWTAQYFNFTRHRKLLTSGGFGTMGYDLPAAIGAQLALREQRVISVVGDGSLQMNIQELATAVEHRLPIVIIILNNRSLGMIRQYQTLFSNKKYSATSLEAQPDFVKLAEAYGAVGFRPTTPEDVEDAITQALSLNRLAIIDIPIHKDKKALPLVYPGDNVSDMILSD